jgi:hypothetical protein
MKNITISDMHAALKVGTIPVQLVRRSGSYCWVLPKAITKDGGIDRAAGLSTARLCDFGHTSKMKARFNIASRFLAQVYPESEVAYINPRYVMKMPNWSGPFGGLPELAYAMKRAGLIK